MITFSDQIVMRSWLSLLVIKISKEIFHFIFFSFYQTSCDFERKVSSDLNIINQVKLIGA